MVLRFFCTNFKKSIYIIVKMVYIYKRKETYKGE